MSVLKVDVSRLVPVCAPSEEKEQERRRDLFYEELLAGGPGDLTDLVGVLVQAQRYDLLQGEVGAGVVEGALQVLTDLPPVPETSKTPVHICVFTLHFVRQCFVTTVLMNGDLRWRSHDAFSQHLSLMAGFLRSLMTGMIFLSWTIFFLEKSSISQSLSCREKEIRVSPPGRVIRTCADRFRSNAKTLYILRKTTGASHKHFPLPLFLNCVLKQ